MEGKVNCIAIKDRLVAFLLVRLSANGADWYMMDGDACVNWIIIGVVLYERIA